jgi:ComF family protein
MVHVAGSYEGNVKDAIHRLKYRNQLTLAEPLGELLVKTVTASDNHFVPDRIIPVPLHIKRLRQRGFNQALEIARPIARRMKVPVDTTLLQRVRETPHQQGLSATERRSNLRDAFSVTTKVPASKILLVDDVMTTGETVRECSRTLKAGGAIELQVAVVGRA